MSKKRITRFSLDPNNLPPLTAKQHAMLDALEKLPDDQINTDDIPEYKFMYKPVKESTTIRLDADVLSWLRGSGRGYQSKINAILRHEMLSLNKAKS